MNFLLTIRHAITGLEQNFHNHQDLANFLHRVGAEIDNWEGADKHGDLPPPTPEVVAEVAAAPVAAPVEAPAKIDASSLPAGIAQTEQPQGGAVFGGTPTVAAPATEAQPTGAVFG
jgi:hypothetical protein